MELYRNGLKLTATIGLDESRGSVNVPVRLLHNEKDKYLNYTEQIHIRYLFDNQVKEEILPTNDNGFYIPGKPLSHDGPIELAVHLINGNIELVTNELSFVVKNAPNGTTQVDPSEFTWQQLVDQYVNAKLDTFANKLDLSKFEETVNGSIENQSQNIESFKTEVNANLSNQDKKITDLQNTTKVSLDSQNTKIDNFKSEVNTSLSNQNTSINQTTSAQNSKITTLESRMDTFTRLSEGSTTGDAELQDIRVGANGITYDTAGNAVRGQYSQLKEDINNVINEFSETIIKDYSGNLFNKNTFIPKKEVIANGSFIDNSLGYGISDFIPVKKGTVYFKNNGALSTGSAYTMVYNMDKTPALPDRLAAVDHVDIDIDFGYIVINIGLWDLNTFSVEYDSKNNGYIPYTERKNKVKTNIVECDELRSTNFLSGIMASVNMFGSVGAVGDSYTAGYSANSSGEGTEMKEQSYIATLCKRAGVEWANYGVTGDFTASYNASSINAVLSDTPKDLYILALGQNDINQNFPKGSVSDIDVNNWLNSSPNTFCGCYGKIITRIKEHAPNAKFIIVKSWIDWDKSDGTSYQSYDDAIEDIANLYGFPCISPFDDVFFNSDIYRNYMSLSHPTTMGYSMMGLAMERLFSKCVVENPSYFQYAVVG